MSVMPGSIAWIGLSWAWSVLLAIPIWLIWTVGGLGTRYFSFLPVAWQSIPLLHMMGLLLLVTMLRDLVSGLKS